jgi:hypothetical protein
MHGNADELCMDWYLPNYYARFGNETAVDPQGPTQAEVKQYWRDVADMEPNKDGPVSLMRQFAEKPPHVARGGSFG